MQFHDNKTKIQLSLPLSFHIPYIPNIYTSLFTISRIQNHTDDFCYIFFCENVRTNIVAHENYDFLIQITHRITWTFILTESWLYKCGLFKE